MTEFNENDVPDPVSDNESTPEEHADHEADKNEAPSPPIQVDAPAPTVNEDAPTEADSEAPPVDVVDNVVTGEETDVEVAKNQEAEPDLDDEDV